MRSIMDAIDDADSILRCAMQAARGGLVVDVNERLQLADNAADAIAVAIRSLMEARAVADRVEMALSD